MFWDSCAGRLGLRIRGLQCNSRIRGVTKLVSLLAPGQKCSNFFLGFGCGRISMGFGCDLGLRFERPHFKFSCECFTFHNSMYSSRLSKSREAIRESVAARKSPNHRARLRGPCSCCCPLPAPNYTAEFSAVGRVADVLVTTRRA